MLGRWLIHEDSQVLLFGTDSENFFIQRKCIRKKIIANIMNVGLIVITQRPLDCKFAILIQTVKYN